MRTGRRLLVILATVTALVLSGATAAAASGSTEIPGSRVTFYSSTNTFAINDETSCGNDGWADGVWKYGTAGSGDTWKHLSGPGCGGQEVIPVSMYDNRVISYRAVIDMNYDLRIECSSSGGPDRCGPWYEDRRCPTDIHDQGVPQVALTTCGTP
ncbi:hypothetical protein WEI85_38645 [Actinomycetes bacterium KLBMP 9797]